MTDSPLNVALRAFEAAEANLDKAEKVLGELYAAVPPGIVFGDNPEYENNSRHVKALLDALPKIDGWKPTICIMELDEIAQNRRDAFELNILDHFISEGNRLAEPLRLLREYRYRLTQKRSELIRDTLVELIDTGDGILRKLVQLREANGPASGEIVTCDEFNALKKNIDQIDTLLGSSVSRPPRWYDLQRHLHFGTWGDLSDITEHDWPSSKVGLRNSMYGEKEPIPVMAEDLSELVKAKPTGPVATELNWNILTDVEFERLIFVLIEREQGYENPQWLTNTNAPDRGRDLSAYRVQVDPLMGTLRERVIVQCKHWKKRSVGPLDVALLKEQMKLWEPPRVDICVIATSGRFTADAVAIIEKHNQSDCALQIAMWPESHLERLLARRPAIIAEFALR
jgi:hypothetical protein